MSGPKGGNARETRLNLNGTLHWKICHNPLRPTARSGGKYREGFRRELNAQFERYPALEADEPMVSGYATFLVEVGLFVGWEGRGVRYCAASVFVQIKRRMLLLQTLMLSIIKMAWKRQDVQTFCFAF